MRESKYEPPAVVYEAQLEVRAGSPIQGPAAPDFLPVTPGGITFEQAEELNRQRKEN